MRVKGIPSHVEVAKPFCCVADFIADHVRGSVKEVRVGENACVGTLETEIRVGDDSPNLLKVSSCVLASVLDVLVCRPRFPDEVSILRVDLVQFGFFFQVLERESSVDPLPRHPHLAPEEAVLLVDLDDLVDGDAQEHLGPGIVAHGRWSDEPVVAKRSNKRLAISLVSSIRAVLLRVAPDCHGHAGAVVAGELLLRAAGQLEQGGVRAGVGARLRVVLDVPLVRTDQERVLVRRRGGEEVLVLRVDRFP